MENTDFVIEHIDEEVKVITDRPSSVVNYPANTDFFIENIDDNVISIAHSLNIEASEVEFRPANTDFFIENIDNNVIMIAESLELEPSEVTIRPANTDFFVENIDKNLIAIAEYYDLEPSRVVLRPANTDMFIENIDRNVTLIKSRTNVITKSGSFINVDVPDGGTMQLSAINGNATQNGTPTPDSPVPVQVVTGGNEVMLTGKNLIDMEHPFRTGATFYNLAVGTTIQTGTDSAVDYTFNSDGTGTAVTTGTWKGLIFVSEKLGLGTYYMNFDGASSNGDLGFTRYTLDKNYTIVRNLGPSTANPITTQGQGTITLTGDECYIALAIGVRTTAGTITLGTLQLELGSTATAYEPYQGQSYTIDLGSIELAKIGTYQDRIYKDDGKWYIEKQVGKVVLDGTEWWSGGTSTGSPTMLYTYTSAIDSTGKWDEKVALSNNYTVIDTKIVTAYVTNSPAMSSFVSIASEQYFLRFMTPLTLASSVANFKTWLASNPVTVYYALATPTTTEITDETLLEQLNFVADMYEGINNISFIGTGAQGTIEVVINKN